MITIRKAILADAQSIIEYIHIVGGQSDNLLFGEEGIEGLTVERERKIINQSQSDNGTMLVAVKSHQIIGLASIQNYGRARIAHRATLAISVDQNYWGQGIATQLMEELIQFARRSPRIEMIELEVRSDNDVAIHLYEKFGFETIGVFPKFFKIKDQYYDADLMVLDLGQNKK